MRDEAKSQLTKILEDYDAKLAEAERLAAADRAADASFPERFLACRAETIRPGLEEIAAMLNAAGHAATVRDQEESSNAVGGVKSAAVSLRVVPRPFVQKSTETSSIVVEVMFSASRAERKVIVSSTNTIISHGGSVGKRGAYEITALTPEVVTTHAIQTLGEAFAARK